jgi:hypothetical protein
MASRTKIGPDEAESDGCGGSTVEDDNEVWTDLRSNPEGWGQFSPFPRPSSLEDTRYSSLLAPRPEKNWLPAPRGKVNDRLQSAGKLLIQRRPTKKRQRCPGGYGRGDGGDAVPMMVPFTFDGLLDIAPYRQELLVAGPPVSLFYGGGLWSLPVPGGQPRRLGNMQVYDAAWSPDGATLYYSSHGSIYAADAEGNQARQLVTVAGNPFWIRLSKDHSLLRFSVADRSKRTSSLWELRSDGTHLHRLLPGFATQPSDCCRSWTPDGKYYIFQATRNDVTAVWAMREGDDWWHRVSHAPVQLTSGVIHAARPLPSRDGRKVFFIGTTPRGELTRYDPNEGNPAFSPRSFGPVSDLLSGWAAPRLGFLPGRHALVRPQRRNGSSPADLRTYAGRGSSFVARRHADCV